MRKKILFISQCFPLPLDGGGKIKTFNTLKTLAKKYDIFAVFISERRAKKTSLQVFKKLGIECQVFKAAGMSESIKNNYWRLVWNYLQLRPHFVYQYHFPPAQKFIKKKIKSWQPDIIHVDHINTSQFLPKKSFLRQNLNQPATLVLENHNLDHLMFKTRFLATKKLIRKIYLFLEGSLNYLYGRFNYPRYDLVLSISEEETQLLQKICPKVLTQKLIYPLKKTPINTKKPYDLIFIGHLEWPPNEMALLWFAEKIFPLILSQSPTVKLHVIGKKNPRLASLRQKKNIVFHGYQKNLDRFLGGAKVYILPFQSGAGVRIKSLSALQNGIPIVSTSLGVAGLKLKNGQEFLLANNSSAFAKKVLQLLNHPSLRKRISQRQRHYFAKNHSLQQNQLLLVQYEQAIKACQNNEAIKHHD